MIFFKTSTTIEEFDQTFAIYVRKTSLVPDEALEKKGRDLSIQIYKGFSAHKYGGDGKKRAGLAKADLASRTAAGEGTRVRGSLLAEYFAKRTDVRKAQQESQVFGPHNGASQRTADRLSLRGIKQRIKLWQSFVAREVAIRQRGIGVLAASFLWFRSRSSQARGVYFVRNKTGRPLGFVEKGEGFLRIAGLTEGLDQVDARYGIVDRAVAFVTADMIEYIKRKDNEAFKAAFGAAA